MLPNTYKESVHLFVICGKEMTSAEDATQGDLLAVSLYTVY